MDIEETIRTRKTIRVLNDQKVLRETVIDILNTARYAPSVHNAQPGYFIILDENIERIWSILEEKNPQGAWNKVRNAQMLVAVGLDISGIEADTKETEAYFQSIGALIENVLLAAHGKGVGCCWLGGNTQRNEESLKKHLNVPESHRLITLISFGYYDSELIIGKPKKDLSEILYYNNFGNKE